MNLAHFGLPIMRRVMEAKKAGKQEVSLTFEELEDISDKIGYLDKRLAKYFDLLSDEMKAEVSKELFGQEQE